MMEMASTSAKRPICLYWSEVKKWAPTSSHLRFGKLPNEWQLLPVSSFAIKIENKEKVVPDREYSMAGVRGNGGGVFHRETVLGKAQSSNYLYPVKPGAIIYNRLFAWKASFAVVGEDSFGFYVSNEFPQFEINQRIALPEYVYLLFTTNKIIGAVKTASIGSAAVSRNRFIESELLSFKVPIPPLPVQKKIVAYWEDTKLKAHTSFEQAKNITNKISGFLMKSIGLKELKRTHNLRAFISTWQEIDRWGVGIAREMSRRPKLSVSPYPVISLSDVINDLQNGWSPKCLTRPAEKDEWGVLKVGAVSFGWFDESQNKALPKSLTPRKQYEVRKGDLIISRANITQYVGACALVGNVRPKLMLCDKLFRVGWKRNSSILPKFLDEILKIPHLRWQIENNLTGASPTMKNISKPAIMSLKFPLPPLDKQNEIVDEIGLMRQEAILLQNKARTNLSNAASEVEKMILGVKSVEDI